MRRALGWVGREDRKAVSLSGFATLADGRTIPVELIDLSRDGCRVQSDETLKIGDRIEVGFGAADPVTGIVRWSLFGTAGVRFHSPRPD